VQDHHKNNKLCMNKYFEDTPLILECEKRRLAPLLIVSCKSLSRK